ncbi:MULTISPECIES: ATP phosphoribosyltransferase regulatory subunit [Thalassolituus]|jgi:ATP phosphoribosyltransferase regulatory subunit|uniref:ATP phosphoribosyltransferase regulatory subunit n=1 Tax=Thalassolituus TaxID=187492 RepID=UPI001E567F79|nr:MULTISPECIES: ATP phosphoribosyltransferase regulatory subunit [Thalassolituus]MBU2038449.1 ATP phosphoribosyltransferase regulatory subunit [Gammaproteobacteria bacterium]MCB2388477.1 ATP phosphoribosyltransferase regulatory subunit [Thalassolituus alkanivorans]MCB2423805.1 ATP phosphoribosyltransferase regulatory subunit [Thalassolituus alkanivorans]
MTSADRWLLPDGIEEVLPPQARRIEQLRRRLLDLLDNCGYDLVIPPALEYLDSLLTGVGKDLDLRTFKVTDQLSGRLMGLSADTTPQVARIDAHSLAPEGISRLSYCRTVFHAKASSLLASRTPTQIGAELYGEAGVGADVEIISLMLTLLESAGVQQVHLDLGHVGVFRALAAKAGISAEQQRELFDLLKLKCATDLEAWAAREIQDAALAEAFALLIRLQGDRQKLDAAISRMAELVPETSAELAHIQQVAEQLAQRFPQTSLYFDLTELRGYNYHTGLVFAAYIPGYGDAIAQGGRYDETGAVFGRARPATGFSADLKVLARFGTYQAEAKQTVVAPNDNDPALWQLIAQLREQGKRVLVPLNDDAIRADLYLKKLDGQWQLVEA